MVAALVRQLENPQLLTIQYVNGENRYNSLSMLNSLSRFLKKLIKFWPLTQNVVYICQKMTHAKYFFCNAKIATTQALQNF